MVSLLRRRAMMILNAQSAPEWRMIIHNSFDTYYQSIESGGNTFVIMDGGDWVEITSNGQNKNNTKFLVNPYYVYADIMNKRCRLTWEVECDSSEVTASNSGFNISIGTYTVSRATGGNPLSDRKGKQDIATISLGNVFGHNVLEFVPYDLLGAGSGGSYFAWNIGCRSSLNGIKFSILQLDFEVYE